MMHTYYVGIKGIDAYLLHKQQHEQKTHKVEDYV